MADVEATIEEMEDGEFESIVDQLDGKVDREEEGIDYA